MDPLMELGSLAQNYSIYLAVDERVNPNLGQP